MATATVATVAVATVAALALTVVALWLEGRSWWCACGRPFLGTFEAWSAHTSQHVVDPYSLTHVLHGFVFFWVLALVWRNGSARWQFVVAIVVEAAWEVLENSPFVIERYRAATAALGYSGDTIANSIGDIASCGMGVVAARWMGVRRSAIAFVATELLLLVWIRDSLLLNVVMLIYPIEAIKHWQLGQ